MTDQDNDTPPASPSWMQSQEPKVAEFKPAKPRKSRRTKAQMAESRASAPPIAGVVVAVDDDTVRVAPTDYETVHHETYTARDLARDYGPLAVGVLALIVAIAALLR